VKVLVAGSGAREHALAWACLRSPLVREVICAPGNAGTAQLARNREVRADDVEGIVELCLTEAVDLVVIGPDAAVAAGLADALDVEGIDCFGPIAAAGRIEASKEFAKDVMNDAGIPTARWVGVGSATRDHGVRFIAEHGGRCVVKADGLALGKGVTVCTSVAEAVAALDACLVEGRFGEAGQRVVIEELLTGCEVSAFALSDGVHVRMLASACDYKRAFDGDQGPMTGGMGSYTPPIPIPDEDQFLKEALATVMQPCVDVLRERGVPYRGCLYAGLMLTDDGLRVLEFNARFGDPETQVVLPMLDEDAVALFLACARGELPGDGARVALAGGACVGVVATSGGYPGSADSGRVITGLDAVDPEALVFHAGTRHLPDGSVVTAGGRVLTVVGRGATLEAARYVAYRNLERISFEGMRCRRDIAKVDTYVSGVRG